MRVDPRRHERPMARRLADAATADQGNARRLHLDADGSVLVEVPEEAIDIIADGRGGRHYQPARAPHRHLLAGKIAEFPEDAEILLMNADGVGDEPRPAEPVMAPDIDIADVTEAVAAELQRIEELADAIFAGVEGIPAVVGAGRVAIGHDHLGQRCTVHDRPQAAGILITDGMKREPFADVEAEPQLPFLPAELIALQREARALRLGDCERL